LKTLLFIAAGWIKKARQFPKKQCVLFEFVRTSYSESGKATATLQQLRQKEN